MSRNCPAGDRDRMKPPWRSAAVEVDPNESPFPLAEIEGIPFAPDSVEARAIRRVLEEYAAARAKVGSGEFAYSDDSPFGIPPRDGPSAAGA
jgi:hypothetical protein